MTSEKDKDLSAEFSKAERNIAEWQMSFVDSGRIEAGEHIVPAKIQGPLATEYSELHMIVNDLSFARDCLVEADKIGLPDAHAIHSKALIFSAVVAYARPFKTGVREHRMSAQYFSASSAFNRELHDYLIAIRDKHIAHSVNEFERAAATGVMVGMPGKTWRPVGVGVTTLNAIGLSRRIVEGAIAQISTMLFVLNARIEQIRPELFGEFRDRFEKDGKWEAAPIATSPDRHNAPKRRT